MANKNAPFGFRAVKHLTGAPYNGQINTYFHAAGDATATYVGDIVKLTGGDDGNGIQAVTTITAVADTPVGVVIGVRYNPLNLALKYIPASTANYLLVADALDLVFQTQDSGTTATGDPGLNVQPLIAAGSATTGNSAFQADGSTKAATATHMFKIQRVVQAPDNELGANGRLEVSWNRHQFGFATAGV